MIVEPLKDQEMEEQILEIAIEKYLTENLSLTELLEALDVAQFIIA